MLKLHLAKSTVALAPHITLEEIGAEYELCWLDFTKAEQTGGAYLAVNAKGRVPALETAHGTLTETAAILTYLAETHADANLLPADAFARGRVNELMLYLAATMHVAHAHKLRGARWADDPAAHDAMRAKVTENMSACAALIEAQMIEGPWVLGARYSIADIYLFTISTWLEGDGVAIAQFPRLAAHFEAMQARPAVARVWAAHQ